MGRADVYLQPDADDPVLEDAVVLDLARRHVPGARVVTAVDESGGEARAYMVDDMVVLKTQRPHRLRPRTSLAKEAYLLDALASQLRGCIPGLLGYDLVETGQGPVEYVCMTRIPGQAVRETPITGVVRRVLLGDLGGILRVLHDVGVESGQVPTDADAAALRKRLEYGFGDIADAFAERGEPTLPLPSTVEDLIGRAMNALPESLAEPAVVLHSNPSPTHVFVDPPTGRFTGVIDFGDSYVSHRALDLHRWPDPGDRVALRDAYLGGMEPSLEFHLMWTVAMIYTDLAAIATGSQHAASAAEDLAVRLDDL
jgi:aminoglycoside phosphotransferase (APT) family kinase protein